jgi:hypothetical protein
MAERIHWWTERCLRSPLFLSLFLTIYPPTNLYSMYLSIYRSIYLSISLSLYLSAFLSINLSFYLSFYLPIFLSVCLPVGLSVWLPLHLSACLSVCVRGMCTRENQFRYKNKNGKPKHPQQSHEQAKNRQQGRGYRKAKDLHTCYSTSLAATLLKLHLPPRLSPNHPTW